MKLSRLQPRDLWWAIPLAVLTALSAWTGNVGPAVLFAAGIVLGIALASRSRRDHPSPPKSREQAAGDRLFTESVSDRSARW